jgi:thiol:disulfide interchange protein DsbG
MKPWLDRGEIELRIIPNPITSVEAIRLTATLLNGKDPGFEFVKHGEEIVNGQPERVVIPDSGFDPKVASALNNNIRWSRANNILQVPFFLFQDDHGDQVFAGPISEARIKQIIASGKSETEKTR